MADNNKRINVVQTKDAQKQQASHPQAPTNNSKITTAIGIGRKESGKRTLKILDFGGRV